MALYANYIPNPSIELATTGWTAYNSGTGSRIGSNAGSGTYSLKIVKNAAENVFGGVQAIVDITPGGLAYTLSLNITGATEEHGAANSAGTKVTIWDLLPGQADSLKAQIATQTFARTTSGRVAIRNFTPRATADRVVITIETASTFYQAQQTTQESTGLVWWSYGSPNPDGSGGTTNPSGTAIAKSTADGYIAAGWTLTGAQNFTFHNTIGIDTWIPSRSGTFKRTVISTPEVHGGESSVYIDAIQIEQGTVESAYVDGSTPGYVWAGSAHNSATLNVAFLEASGSVALSGPDVEMLLLKFMEASGALALTGANVETTLGGTVSGVGILSSSGGADIWSYGGMGGSVASSLVGAIELYAIVPISSDGTAMGGAGGSDAPSAQIRLAWDVGGSTGTPMSLSGTVDLTFPQPIAAAGELLMDGTAHIDIGWQLASAGSMELFGIAQIDDATPAGAFGDFAIWSASTTDSDPLMLGIGGSNAGTNSGANGANWVRIHGEFIAPADQPTSGGKFAWRRAAYAGVGFTYANVPASNYQELACIQLEPSSADNSPGPRAFEHAKTVIPMVWADRINFAKIEWWQFFGSTHLAVTTGGTSPIPGDSHNIRVLTWQTSGFTGFFGSNIISPPPNSYCIASFYARGTMPTIESRILNNANLQTIKSSGVVELDPVQWTRVEIAFRAAEIEQIFCIADPDRGLTYPATLEIAGVMVERATKIGEFFDFAAGTSDYFYRDNGVDPSLGVFYYKNINERIPLLTAALDEHRPSAVRIDEPQFGLIPTLD